MSYTKLLITTIKLRKNFRTMDYIVVHPRHRSQGEGSWFSARAKSGMGAGVNDRWSYQ